MKASEYLLQTFSNEGVNHVFMVPGMHVDPIISAFKKFPNMHPVVATHEGGAAFMADGYAKASGKFGVAAGIAGPGVTNMVTGITCAYSDSTPLFVITGETNEPWEGRGAFQDSSVGSFNANAMLAPVTVKRLQVHHAEILQHHVDLLMRTMLHGATRGPVQLEFTRAAQAEDVDFTPRKLPYLSQPRFVDHQACDNTWKKLTGAKKVAILAGMGTLHANASEELIRFAEQYEIPVATTHAAKGVFPEDHRLALGVFGWYGNPYAMETLLSQDIEVLIVLGARFSQISTAGWSKKLIPSKALIVNDINEASYYGNYMPDLFVLGDAQEYLKTLNNASADKKQILLANATSRKAWMESIRQKGPNFYDIENLESDILPIHPARVIQELKKAMPSNTLLFTGEGASSFFAAHYWVSRKPREYFTQVKYVSAMGWSIAAAIGGKLARPDATVVSIIGDGSMLMHGLEIQTAVRNNTAVIFVLMNNGAHGNPQLRAEKVGEFEDNFMALPFHDWAKIAEGLGLVGISVTKPEELAGAFKQALALNKPVLLDIRTGNYDTPVKIPPFVE